VPRRLASLSVATFAIAACSLTREPPLPPAPASTPRVLSRAILAADIDSMLAAIERVHPNAYSVVSRDSVRRARDAIVARLPDSADRITAWPSYARLVAMLGDGHRRRPAVGPDSRLHGIRRIDVPHAHDRRRFRFGHRHDVPVR